MLSVKEKPEFWSGAKRKAGVLHQDLGYPVVYPGGALWLFGDTFYGRETGGKETIDGAVTNSVMHLGPDGGAEYFTDKRGMVRAAIPLRAPETWDKIRLWPFSGVFSGGRFHVFHSITELTGGSGFKNIGAGLARSKGTDWRSWKRVRLKSALPFKEPPCWLVEAKNGFIYAYFIDTKGFDSSLHVARFRVEDMDDPAAWHISPGPVLKGVFGQVSVAWNDHLGKYLLIHAGDVFKEPRTLWLRAADDPAGPFSEPVKIFEKPGKIEGNFKGIFYSPFIHPELSGEGGRRIYVTYGVNLENHGDPRLLEIELGAGQ